MDAQEIFTQWTKNNRLPSWDTIVELTLAGKTSELELVAVIYIKSETKINITKEQLNEDLIKKIQMTWNAKIMGMAKIEPSALKAYPSLKQPDDSVDSLISSLSQLTIAPADDIIANKSDGDIRTLGNITKSLVSMTWVRECASKLIGESPFDFVFIEEDTERHVHHVNHSVIDFLHELSHLNPASHVTTWQFEAGRGYALHLQSLYKSLTQLCPETPFAFLVFACSIGVPTQQLLKTKECLDIWKKQKFNTLSYENIIKVLLRPRFESGTSDIEVNELLRQYQEHVADFRLADVESKDVETFVYKKFYSYPTVAEIKNLHNRILNNTQRWTKNP